MLTIQNIKDEISIKKGYSNWIHAYMAMNYKQYDMFIDECMQEYAKQTAIAQREADAENAECFIPWEGEEPQVAKGSILNTKLVVD